MESYSPSNTRSPYGPSPGPQSPIRTPVLEDHMPPQHQSLRPHPPTEASSCSAGEAVCWTYPCCHGNVLAAPGALYQGHVCAQRAGEEWGSGGSEIDPLRRRPLRSALPVLTHHLPGGSTARNGFYFCRSAAPPPEREAGGLSLSLENNGLTGCSFSPSGPERDGRQCEGQEQPCCSDFVQRIFPELLC